MGNRLDEPISGRIQQGAVFNCVDVPNYEAYPCYGIVITARCDLAHSKGSAVNYLPVIPLSAWVRHDLVLLVASEVRKSTKNELVSKLRKELKVSQSILDTFSLKEVIQREATGRMQQTMLDTYEKLVQAEAILCDLEFQKRGLVDLFSANEKKVQAQIERLVAQEHSEYYFVNNLDVAGTNTNPGVVLLRYMQTISYELMSSVVRGIDAATLGERTVVPLTFKHESICMIMGVLRSPDIEHLAQTFSHLFTRIGLQDQEDDCIDQCMSIAKGK